MKTLKLLSVPLCVLLASCAVKTKHDVQTQRPSSKSATGKKGQPSARPLKEAPVAKQNIAVNREPAQPLPPPTPVAPSLQNKAQAAIDFEKAGKPLEALQEYLTLYKDAVKPEEQEQFRQKVIEIVQVRLDESSLQTVAKDSAYGIARPQALYELGQIYSERGDTDSARTYFNNVVSLQPGSQTAFQAEQALLQMQRSHSVAPQTIGVVLPLTGKSAAVGQKALRGIELGLRLNDPNSNFKLAVVDSEGNPDTARRGVERLVLEDNVIAIIGSLLSKTAPAVSAKASEYGVPVIGLSQRAGITESGPTVFRNALTAEMQVRQIVRSAMEDMDMKKFAILAPNDSYGVEYANLFWDEVLARGGTIVAAQIYDPKKTDFRAECQRLVNTWYVEGRNDEYKLILKESAQASGGKKGVALRNEKNFDDVLPAEVDFDAVFIPDSVKMMNTLAAFLSYAGVRDVKLLGTNLWNVPNVGKQAGMFSDKIVFVDSWLNSDANSSRFAVEFKKVFGDTPSLIEMQAYDSAVLLQNLISQGAGSREALVRQLTDLKKFPGAAGYLSMTSTREIRRPLTTFATTGGQVSPLKVRR